MGTANDVDCKLNDFSHVKISRYQTTKSKANDDEATNASSRHRYNVLIFTFSFSYSIVRFLIMLTVEPLVTFVFFSMINWVLIEMNQHKMNCIIKEEIKNILSLIKRRKKKREYRISLIIVLHILEITWICSIIFLWFLRTVTDHIDIVKLWKNWIMK
jgi:hypothetical protein